MKEKLLALAAAISAKRAEIETALTAARTNDDAGAAAEHVTRAETLAGEMEELQRQHTILSRIGEIETRSSAAGDWLGQPQHNMLPTAAVTDAQPTMKRVFARPRRHAGLVFSDDPHGWRADEKAFGFGMFALATARNAGASKWLNEHGIEHRWVKASGDADLVLKAMTEGVNTAGGYLVPEEFDADVIALMVEYGTFRRNAQVRRMTRDTVTRPRRTSGVTAYFVGENTAPTESTKGWDQIRLTAKKVAVLTKASSELNEDAIIDLGNDLAREIAYACAMKEDQCGFLGDGTSTYGGILGVIPGFQKTVTDAGGTWTTDAHKIYNPSIVCAAGNAFSEVTMANLLSVVGTRLTVPLAGRLAWYCNPTFYWEVLARLVLASGGVLATEVVEGRLRQMFLGYPVEFVEVMISQEANSGCPLLYGDLASAATFGDRREVTIAMSEHLNFAEDELAFRGTERFDISVHDLGTANSSAASRVKAPLTMLALANA
jgi:HK97 family phage major capsid protein